MLDNGNTTVIHGDKGGSTQWDSLALSDVMTRIYPARCEVRSKSSYSRNCATLGSGKPSCGALIVKDVTEVSPRHQWKPAVML